MNLSTLLNSDLSTSRMAGAHALRWWLDQLKSMLPRRMQRPRRPRGPVVLWHDGVLNPVGKSGARKSMPRPGASVSLVVPAPLAFVRDIQLPSMSVADVRRMVELEAERLSPLPRSECLVAMEVIDGAAQTGASLAEIAVLPRRIAREAIETAQEAGLTIAGFGLAATDGAVRFDFMASLREQQMADAQRSPATIWWTIVAVLVALNVTMLVIRDRQSVAELRAIAQQQAPAVAAARAVQIRASAFDATAQLVVRERRNRDVLAALGILSESLPDGAWVQRLTYDGQTARLTGYSRGNLDIAAALRRQSRIAGVSANNAPIVAETPGGQPFDIAVRFRRTL